MTREYLEALLEREHLLTFAGFSDSHGEDYNEQRSALATSDLALLGKIEALLAMIEKTRSFPGSSYSYSLKHCVENALGTYVANGQLILAAIASGFRYRRAGNGLNCVFGMSRRGLELLHTLDRHGEALRRANVIAKHK